MSKKYIKKSKCPKCRGSGKEIDHLFGAFTIGIGYCFQLLDNDLQETCSLCKGSRLITEYIIIES